MIYLDYAAHTPVCDEVLKSFEEAARDFTGNPNSPHTPGVMAKKRLEEATENIAKILSAKKEEIIYTSGASESNNLAIKGIAKSYQRYGKHIITSFLEHASVTGPVAALKNEGYEVDFVNINKDGSVDLEHLKELLRDDTILVSIACVDSEIGAIQPIDKIYELVKTKPHCFFHVDATQAVGKIPVSFQNMDLMTLSGHKIYGITGIGVLLKKEQIMLEPLIHGGLSTTSFRSGTPALALCVSLESALAYTTGHLEEFYDKVREKNLLLRRALEKNKNIVINTPEDGSPFILNLSLKGVNTNALQAALDEKGICVATKSACCAVNTVSKPVYAMTKDKKLSLATLRISLSHMTTAEEIERFLDVFLEAIKG
ncbi:cysteine desulfurase family protein [Anaerocolumna xylanovorans]|nr:cysteine desulfurase family protein [Anaerocolumna xylanovorans]